MVYTTEDLFGETPQQTAPTIEIFRDCTQVRHVLISALNPSGDVFIQEDALSRMPILTIDEYGLQEISLAEVTVLKWLVEVSILFMSDFDRLWSLPAEQLQLPPLDGYQVVIR